MTAGAGLTMGLLWLATFNAFRRDAAWELFLQGLIFALAGLGLLFRGWRTPGSGAASDGIKRTGRTGRSLPAKIAIGLAAVALLGVGQIAGGLTISNWSTALATVKWLSLAAWCWVVREELGNARSRWLEVAVMGAALVVIGSFGWRWLMGGEGLGPWVNRNHLAVWCEMLLAPAVWLALERPAFGAAAAVLAVGGAASGSRAALGLIPVELIVLWWLIGRRRLPAARLGLGLAAVVALAGVMAGEDLARKLRDPEPLLYRDQIWRSAWTLWKERPAAGSGLGTFEKAYPAAATFDTGETVDHAHNDWLEWGSEGGVPLVTLMLAAWIAAVRWTRAVPWLAGVPVAGVHALVDYPFARFPLLLWVILLITLAGARRLRFKVEHQSVAKQTNSLATRKKGASSPHVRSNLPMETALD